MLTTVKIKNFQSLKKVELELDKFTIVVGPSSSGKSAFLRALKVASSNPRGSSFVTVGEKFSSIRMDFDDSSILLEKGDGHGKYVLTDGGEEKKFLKLAGAVPEDVAKFVNIRPELNFSSQFDKPYLLDETGANVARTFGELTNVTRIFDAVREGNRRKGNNNKKLKLRQEDLSSIREEIKNFESLKEKIEAQNRAEVLLSKVDSQQTSIEVLEDLISRLDMAESVLAEKESKVELPDIVPLFELKDRFDSLKSLLVKWKSEIQKIQDLDDEIAVIESTHKDLEDKFSKALEEAGQCPLCGSEVTSHEHK